MNQEGGDVAAETEEEVTEEQEGTAGEAAAPAEEEAPVAADAGPSAEGEEPAAEEAEEEMAAVEETAAVEERAEEEEEKPVAPSAGASRGPGERHEPDPVPLVPAETLAPINVAPATAEDDPATKTPTPLREERPTALVRLHFVLCCFWSDFRMLCCSLGGTSKMYAGLMTHT